MAKNYKETTTQAAVLRTSTKTLSFWCNIREAPLERFAELIEGNIRIALQDFSGGKGDKSKFAYFNLEISDIYEIKDCMQAKKSFFAQKIYGKHPETGGQFNGMCKSFHFALQYTEKAQNGELSRNPYYLCIKNGFAQAAPGQIAGSFYERKGTFQEGVAVFIRLSERDLKNLLRKVTDYIRVFQMRIQGKRQLFRRKADAVRIHMKHIMIGMNTGIRARTAADIRPERQQLFEGILHSLLDADGILLYLPSAITCAVIHKAHGDTRLRRFFRRA